MYHKKVNQLFKIMVALGKILISVSLSLKCIFFQLLNELVSLYIPHTHILMYLDDPIEIFQ